ncbi:hypothetical protein EIP91_008771 [Steccherinum ochraceum]|uniref:Methyltransferase domain-containing protein n=1 Tax=Steccherinum ochraceum TaxID=92696 RepID=A0A4R0R2E1_9APHY|nr:hypothetical protein EIP91_008771 [Steccherinum ochraceum]
MASAAVSVWGSWRCDFPIVYENWGPQETAPPSGVEGEVQAQSPSAPSYHQCVFLRGYRVFVRTPLFTLLKASAGHHEPGSGSDDEHHAYGPVVPANLGSSTETVLRTDIKYVDALEAIAHYIFLNSNAPRSIVHDSDIAELVSLANEAGMEVVSLSEILDTLRPNVEEDEDTAFIAFAGDVTHEDALHVSVNDDWDEQATGSDDNQWSDTSSEITEFDPTGFPRYFVERNGRLFHSHTGSPYPFPVDTDEQNRRALDLGTGTGIWVEEMASEFPDVRFDGLDIVPIASRYPPANVMFEMHDIGEPFRYADRYYDLVHARSVSMAVHNYAVLLDEVARVLRPRGLFVAGEWTRGPAMLGGGDPSVHLPRTTEFFRMVNHALAAKNIFPVAPFLHELIEESNHFEDVHSRQIKIAVGGDAHGDRFRELQKVYAESMKVVLLEADISLILFLTGINDKWSFEAAPWRVAQRAKYGATTAAYPPSALNPTLFPPSSPAHIASLKHILKSQNGLEWTDILIIDFVPFFDDFVVTDSMTMTNMTTSPRGQMLLFIHAKEWDVLSIFQRVVGRYE